MTSGPIRDNCRDGDGRKKQSLQTGARHVAWQLGLSETTAGMMIGAESNGCRQEHKAVELLTP